MASMAQSQLALGFASAIAAKPPTEWCMRSTTDGVWDGVDWDRCFRISVFDGILPLVFLSLSGTFILLSAVRAALASLARSRKVYIRLATEEHPAESVPSPIAQAEADVLRRVAQKQSPDWRNPSTQRELLGVYADEADARLLQEVTPTRSGLLVVLRAVWGSKKDVVNVVGAAGVVALCALKLVRALRARADGRGWVAIELASWAWVFLLTLVKLALAFHHRLFALKHPDVPHRNMGSAYAVLERHIIPYFVGFSALTGFFDLRSAVLDYHSFPYGPAREAVRIEGAIFAVSSILAILEFFAPRPSQFSSRSSTVPMGVTVDGKPLPPTPEVHASLASLATFSYMESFQLRCTFPKRYDTGPLKLEDIPDLRPDDKTARVLLTYRQSLKNLDAFLARVPLRIRRRFLKDDEGAESVGLTWKLLWHFMPALLTQNMWSLVRVAMNGIPPLMLKGILAHIAARNRGEDAPIHVAVLYAWALFLTTVIGSIGSSLALFVGRRVCVRLRSIIVGEVFTKALRRKDQAGSSATHAEASTASDTSPAPKPTTVAAPNAQENEEAASPSETIAEGKEDLEKIEADLDKASSGKILNLVSVDAYRLSEICAYLHFLTSEMPLTIVVICYLLFRLLGWSALPGISVLIAIMPVTGYFSKLYIRFQGELLAAADQRLELTTEVISQLRIVKFFGWESKFIEKMEVARKKELSAVWNRALAVTFGCNLTFGTPILVGIATFVTHTKVLHRPLTAETAFTALALFTVLRGPLEGFTDMLVNVLQAHVSLGRIDGYLHEEETHKYSILAEPATADDPTVGFVNGTFTWADKEKAQSDPNVFRIRDLNLRFPEGQLSIVLGPVGSGKSSLLLSLLGETNRLSGKSFLPSPVIRSAEADPARLTNTTAYAAQSPWLMSATIRDNILFGAPHNPQRYQATLEACALLPDLKQLELGDETEVGEKGTVLSGGQKARLSLARAIYSSAKVVLLDDVLSAVDSHTAQHLVEKCLVGPIMRHRTCVLVTHATDLCLPYSNFVVTLDQGSVVSAGAPDSLSSSRVLALEEEQQAHESAQAAASAITIEAIADGETDEAVLKQQEDDRRKRIEELKLIKDETQAQGSVKREVYLLYIKALGAWKFVVIAFFIFVGAQLSDIAVSLALRYWAGSFDNKESVHVVLASTIRESGHRWQSLPIFVGSYFRSAGAVPVSTNGVTSDLEFNSDFWLAAYCVAAVINLTLAAGRVGYVSWAGIGASRRIYRQLIARILRSPIRFFDSTPTGRILNRLSKDMETIDQELPSTFLFLTLEILMIIGIIGTVSVALPSFLIAGVFISVFYWVLGLMYLSSSRELKRFESVTRSPIFSVFGESLQGVATIRAYGDASRFMKKIFHLVDENNRPFFTLWAVNRWLSFRVDAAAGAVSLVAAHFVIFARTMDPALAGFVMSFAMAFAERALWTTRLWSQLEMQANSIERVQEYLELDQENQGGVRPPAIWPTRGATIKVKNLTAAYAPELPAVLKDVTFTVKGGEKVGIVGRTGSGKSSLALSFFRFIEPTSGNITIDGLDINTLALEDLRSRLTIVAQEAALFKGSLRFNLDPFGQHTDRDLWDALRRVQMAAPGVSGITPKPTPGQSRVASPTPSDRQDLESEASTAAAEETERYIVKSLDMEVTEGGKNFSAGQRQLLALARGILKLKSSSILILDESTASLDHATDERIQQTIRSEMADATILCIAHRLKTVIDYDKILVLDQGRVVEFDTPATLLAQEDSAFAALCRKSGEFELLKEMANKTVKGGE